MLQCSINIDDLKVEETEAHIGPNSVHHGATVLPGPHINGSVLINEGSMILICMMYGHVRMIQGMTPHIQTDASPIINGQLRAAFDSHFLWFGWWASPRPHP